MISSSYGNENPMTNSVSNSYNFNNITASSGSNDNINKYSSYLEATKKPAYNVVYEPNVYNPWGKPGGGAPKLNNNTGELQTKIMGTLQWNLNGETEADRIQRSMNYRSKTNQNLNMFKKNAHPSNMSPRQPDSLRTNTTYSYNFREPINPYPETSLGFSQPQSFQPSQSQGIPQFPMSSPGRPTNTGSLNMTPRLQQEAEERSLNRSYSNAAENLRPKGFSELNRLANKLNTNNQPSTEYPNMSYWFGRAGQNKTTIGNFPNQAEFTDPRRRKLLDSLEHRTPRDVPKIYGLDNDKLPQNNNISFVNDPHSNHRNMYENNPMKN